MKKKMKSTVKDLEKRIEQLESKLEICSLYIQNQSDIKKFYNNPQCNDECGKVKKLRLDKSQLRYKIGDYVEFKITEKIIRKGTIISKSQIDDWVVETDNREFVTIFDEDIISYAKPNLLTSEEKEYLSAVIKPFRDRVLAIRKTEHSLMIQKGANLYYLPLCFKFDGLTKNMDYTLKELSL